MKMIRKNQIGFLFVLFILVSGCAPQFQVKPAKENAWYDKMQLSALHTDHLSYHTSIFLHDYLLQDDYQKNPLQTLTDFDRSIGENLSRDNLFAMAELCYNLAKSEKKDFTLQSKLYLTSARYAYAYLFEEIGGSLPERIDPRYRLACDFYNRSLAQGIHIMLEHQIDLDAIGRKLALLNGSVYIQKAESDLLFHPQDFERLLDPYQYEINGIEFVHRQYGLGAPFIALKTVSAKDLSVGVEETYKSSIQLAYPATLIVRFLHPIALHATGATETAISELYDPTRYDHVEINADKIPLESDFTTPLAYKIAQGKTYSGFLAMLNIQEQERRQGLYLLQPYDPQKIPVVFIHGLMSYPQTWIPMINSLLSDTALHQKYQFWFYAYPTGNPIIINAHRLRQTLLQTKAGLDPEGDDVCFNRMVLIGHSMGGVLSQLMVQSSPDGLWDLATRSKRTIDELDISEEYKTYFHQLLEFQPLPFVTRVVFMATPHRGSDTADTFIGRLGVSLVSLPMHTVNMFKTTLKALGNENIRTCLQG